MQTDHIFICAPKNAPRASELISLGLIEGAPNAHPGQGTANRRFFFDNFMLEFLWLENAEEALSETSKPLRLWERALGLKNACPFGIALRPSHEGENAPFLNYYDYKPAYLPKGLSLHIAQNTPLNEPLYFYLPFAKKPSESLSPAHKIPLKKLSAAKIYFNGKGPLSENGRAVNKTAGIAVIAAGCNCLELEFDGALSGNFKDLRPLIPLVLK